MFVTRVRWGDCQGYHFRSAAHGFELGGLLLPDLYCLHQHLPYTEHEMYKTMSDVIDPEDLYMTSAIGLANDTFKAVLVQTLPRRAGDVTVLCSDGIWSGAGSGNLAAVLWPLRNNASLAVHAVVAAIRDSVLDSAWRILCGPLDVPMKVPRLSRGFDDRTVLLLGDC